MNRKLAGIFLVAEETLGGYRLPREARDTITPRTTTEFLLRHKPGSTPHCAWPRNVAGRNHESLWR